MNKRWNSLMCVGAILALAGQAVAGSKEAATSVAESSAKDSYEAKLRAVIIPRIEFKEASLADALGFLRKAAAEQKFEVNIVNTVPAKEQLKITLSLQDIPLYEALRYVTQIADLKFEIKENAVLITPIAK